MGRTKFFRDLHVWQKAMELAREVYLQTEGFPKSETFGLRMQLRRSAVSVASHIAEGHGRLSDSELQKCLGMARGSLYEFETQLDLASGLGFLNTEATEKILDLATQTAKLINGLLRSVDPERATQKRQPAN